ncbi:unnamed protein product [Ixodes hexagonus]
MRINFDKTTVASITKKKSPLMFSYEINGEYTCSVQTFLSISVLLYQVIVTGTRMLEMYVILHIENFVS